MDERSETDKMDEIMLPGFRFHPTDEELVGFYLKRKAQQRPLSVELIKQLDIYKYDPWDLPKLASTGEKEWYFYCPRDRKYRNSARPNRVTAAGFWKATGTDRPIYSSEGSRCIGLKKSLVFYRGRAAKGIKTDWMMHEYRLPSLTESAPQKRFMDKNVPANDSWAICRIFKKTNSNTQRAISHSWISPLPETTSEIFNQTAKSSSPTQFSFNNDLLDSCITSFSPLNVPSYTFSSLETSLGPPKPPVDSSPMFFNMSSSSTYGDFGKTSESVNFIGYQDHCNGFSFTIPQEMETEVGAGHGEETALMKDPNGAHFDDQWGTVRSVGTPFSLPDAWKSNFLWDYSPCPTEISPNYFTNKCYT